MVSHATLLAKLKKIWSIDSTFLRVTIYSVSILMEFYLTFYSFCLVSLLGGPLLVIVYITDLTTKWFSPLVFADDTKCLKIMRGLTNAYLMQLDLNSLSAWSESSGSSFNQSKFIHLQFLEKYQIMRYSKLLH